LPQGFKYDRIGEPNINAVFTFIQSKANSTYRQDLADVEVQMLSKLYKAVLEFEKRPHLVK